MYIFINTDKSEFEEELHLNFTTATIKEIDELTKIRIAYVKDEQNGIDEQVKQEMLKKLPGYFCRHLSKDLIAFIAKDNNEIIATAFLLIIEKPNSPNFINGMIGNVLNVYTMPQYRKKGISTRLMNNLIEYAKERNLDFIELKATKEGYPLYKKLGFIDYHSEYENMRLPL